MAGFFDGGTAIARAPSAGLPEYAETYVPQGWTGMAAFWSDALARSLLLYAALYAGFGVLSPYLPSLLKARGLHPEAIALVLAAGAFGGRPCVGSPGRPP